MKIAFTACIAIFGIIAATLLLAPQAEAGLVEDLRSGKSDIRASSTSGAWIGVISYWKKQKSAPDFKAIVTTRSFVYGWQQAGSAEQAVEGAIRYCKEHGGGRTSCQVYAVGDAIVEGYSQDRLADAIEAYNLKVSGGKSTTSSKPLRVYCRNKNGSAFASRSSCGSGTQITISEFKRIKAKKTDSNIGDSSSQASTETGDESNPDSIEAKLEKLKGLLDKGLITAEEAKAKRAKLLDDL